MALYKYLEHGGKKHPIRISNCVLGEYQEESKKTDLQTMTYRDVRILMWHALQEGYEFAEKPFDLKLKDVKLMVDDRKTVERFLLMLPEFFPAEVKTIEGAEGDAGELGKQQSVKKT